METAGEILISQLDTTRLQYQMITMLFRYARLIYSFLFVTHNIFIQVAHFLLVNKLSCKNFLAKELSEQQRSFNNYCRLLYILIVRYFAMIIDAN